MITEKKEYHLFGKTLFEKVVIKPPFKIPNPMPNEACFLYILEGRINYSIGNDKILVPSNEAVLLKCGNYFSQLRSSGNSKTNKFIVIHFHPEILKNIYGKDLPYILKHPPAKNPIQDLCRIDSDFLIRKYIEGLLFYFDNPSLVHEEILILKLKEIIFLLCQTKNAGVIQQILSQLITPWTYTFQQFVSDHLYTDLTVEELAELAGQSISSFKRQFKKIYGSTPARYIRSKKLEKAAELLLITNERITDIAYDCGFNDLPHFSTSFAGKYRVSPSAFRTAKKIKE